MMMAGEAEYDDDDEDEFEDVASAICPAGTDGSEQKPRPTAVDTLVDEAVETPSRRCRHLRDNWNKNDRRDSWIGRDVMSRC